ncbi:hypothetical protein J2S74_001539 [Evansella vedderi]|uniref:Uncharacterized protein n=1 Tax=Evansella vedderi TaxID=38282 RepID=A0ABT9ZSF8_9BACI|nr:hypothetical protein [Evansella vedderi]MDQ0254166.1 hypothetical protein [Evansella vedderi]
MKRLKVTLLILFLVHSIVFLPSAREVKGIDMEQDPVDKHVIVLLVPGLSFEELDMITEQTNYPYMWKKGAYGAVNLRPDGNYSYLNNAVSIGTGKRALGISDWNAYNKDEKVNDTTVDNLMLQWYGTLPVASVLHPHVNLLINKNLKSSFQPVVGWFGESLQEKGVFTYVMGNSDTRDEKVRYASLLTMDRKGEANGDLQKGVVDNIYAPSGMSMEPSLIKENIKHIHSQNDKTFVVVEWGDFYRLFQEEPNMLNDHFQKVYKDTFQRLEETIYQLLSETGGEIWLLSPAVNSVAYKNKNQLGPLWVWHENRDEKGLLYSETTRRYSLLSNTDIAITWDNIFLGPSENRNYTVGYPIKYLDDESIVDQWSLTGFQQRIKEITYVFDKRGAVLSSYVSSLVVMLIVVSLMIWLLKDSRKWKKVAQILLLSGILSPLLFLITSPWINAISPFLYVAAIFLGSLGLAALLKVSFRQSYSIACFLFFSALTVDIITGSYFIQRSFLSYDPVIGARYYGIGNEFAGIYLVSGLLMIAPLLKEEGKTLTKWLQLFVVIMGMILVLGLASLGANAGASISASIIMIYISIQLLLKDAKWRVKFIIAAGIPLLMLGFLYILQMAQPSSHIFTAFQKLFSGDFVTIWQTIERKIQMNWKIFKISYWTQLFVTSYFFIGIVLWRRQREQLHSSQLFLINCCIIGSLALLVLNDSGIVAAATSMFITLSVCYGWSIEGEGKKV